MRRRRWTPFFVLVSLAHVLGFPLASAAVERVILVSIDGIRNSEGFGDPDCQGLTGDGSCWLAKLAALRPSGTLYTTQPNTEGSAFLNNAAPWTTPGHNMLLTGARHIEPNRGTDLDLRPFRPTLFERLRKQLGWTIDEAVLVVSKPNVEQSEHSFDPAHGELYEGKLYVVPGGQPNAEEDVEVATAGQCLMKGRPPLFIGGHVSGCGEPGLTKPRFLFLHFGGVDARGHANASHDPSCETGCPYDDAIKQVDAEIDAKIWGELCDLPSASACSAAGKNPDFRRDNTVLFVVPLPKVISLKPRSARAVSRGAKMAPSR